MLHVGHVGARRTPPVILLSLLIWQAGCANSPLGNSSSISEPGWPEQGRVLAQHVAKEFPRIPPPDADAAEAPDRCRVEIVLSDLTYPTSIALDDAGNFYVAEAGYSYGDPVAPARILRVTPSGEVAYIADQFNGPSTGLLFHEGRLLVSHFGKVSALESDGTIHDLVPDLPLSPAHPNSEPTVAPDGKVYFGVGLFTNSGVVGLDEVSPFLGLLFWPDMYDVPLVDLELTGENYVTPKPMNVLAKQGKLTADGPIFTDFVSSLLNKVKHRSLLVRTGAFQAFGQNERRVRGQLKPSTTVPRMNPDGSDLEIYAWGLRSPFGLRWGLDGRLYCSDNAYDERGSRPIANAEDNVFAIREGGWYGFPDYSSGIPVTDERFRSSRGPAPPVLLKNHPPVEAPLVTRPAHSAVAKFDFGPGGDFGCAGQIFLSEFGPAGPVNTPNVAPAGYQVARVDLVNGRTEPFFRALSPALGPPGKEHVVTPWPRRPVDARFSPTAVPCTSWTSARWRPSPPVSGRWSIRSRGPVPSGESRVRGRHTQSYRGFLPSPDRNRFHARACRRRPLLRST